MERRCLPRPCVTCRRCCGIFPAWRFCAGRSPCRTGRIPWAAPCCCTPARRVLIRGARPSPKFRKTAAFVRVWRKTSPCCPRSWRCAFLICTNKAMVMKPTFTTRTTNSARPAATTSRRACAGIPQKTRMPHLICHWFRTACAAIPSHWLCRSPAAACLIAKHHSIPPRPTRPIDRRRRSMPRSSYRTILS